MSEEEYLRVLFVEDCRADAELCVRELESGGYRCEWDIVDRAADVVTALDCEEFDVVLLDYGLPGWSGFDAIQLVRQLCDTPIILVTGSLGDETAVDCIHGGASDYVLKNNLVRLIPAVRRALEAHALRRERHAARAERDRLLHDLQERVKELTCIFEVSKLAATHAAISEILEEVAARLPAAMQFPEAASARIRYAGRIYGSAPGDCGACLSSELVICGRRSGTVEVCYMGAERGPEPFLEEERNMLEAVARAVGDAIERHQSYAELEQRVAERTADLARVNEELRLARAEWEQIFDCMSDSVTYQDPQYRILRANRAFRVMFPDVQLEHARCYEVFHGTNWPLPSCPMEKTLASGKTESCEVYEPRSGRYLNLRTDPVKDASGAIVRIVHIVSDITERKASQALQERLAAILQASTELVATVAEDGQVVYLNQAGRRMLGLAHGDAGPLNIAKFYPGGRDSLVGKATGAAAWSGETTLRRQEGSEFPVLLGIVVHPRTEAAGEFISLVAHDITQRKQIERMKDELVSTVSHELRTPLASMMGFTELLLSREYDEEKRREFLGVVHAESKRLAELVNNLLDLQRIESGGQVCNFELYDVAPLLRECLALFEVAGGSHSFFLDAPEELPAVRVDPGRMRQVVNNLLSNAVKYSPDGGAVQLVAQTDEIRLLLSVSDHGIGLAPEDMPRLFTRFFRGDNAAQRGIRGSGLGLALCREIVRSMEGEIWAESSAGCGTTFHVALPVAVAAPRAAAARAAALSG